MHPIAFAPFFRAGIGFDRLRDLALAGRSDGPPYDVERTGEDTYRVTLAVPGFGADELAVTASDGALTVSGRRKSEDGERARFLRRGIEARGFERRFALAEHVRPTGATLADGMLRIEIRREVPEAAKPRAVPITTAAPAVA